MRTNVLGRGYYANASGDFLLLDAPTYRALRGFNEVFREAKIHKDANFCVHAVARGLPVEVLGQVYHLDHESSWNNVAHVYMANPSTVACRPRRLELGAGLREPGRPGGWGTCPEGPWTTVRFIGGP